MIEEEIAGIVPYFTLHFCSRSYSNFLHNKFCVNPGEVQKTTYQIIDHNTEVFFLQQVNSQRIKRKLVCISCQWKTCWVNKFKEAKAPFRQIFGFFTAKIKGPKNRELSKPFGDVLAQEYQEQVQIGLYVMEEEIPGNAP